MRLLWLLLLFLAPPVAAQQTAFADYPTVQKNVFWLMLYPFGGRTLYCNVQFKPGQRKIDGRIVTIEHAFPADWIAEHHGCENRNSCDIPEYGYAEADLHNLWPAIGNINSSRGDQSLGEIPGEQRRFEEYCADFERTQGDDAIVEPRDAVKGDMARSILYMLDAYGLELPSNMALTMLLKWHLADPPDDAERWRNFAIKQIQGNRNPYIQ